MHTDLADSLTDVGQYNEARKEYEAGLKIDDELKDLRGQGVTLGQLGTLAMLEGDLNQALTRYQAALALFQKLREPAVEASAWHQLGLIFQTARQWDDAERHYREAARLKEQNGLIGGPNGAASTWHQLAQVSAAAGNLEAAERWYRKAAKTYRGVDDCLPLAKCLNNLAGLLQTQPTRLTEARQLAEEALALKKTLDPAATEIWKTYTILADIAEKEAPLTVDSRRQAELQAEARDHRRLAREAKRNFAGTRHEMKKYLPLILATFMAAQDSSKQDNLDVALNRYSHASWAKLVNAVHRIGGGERDPNALSADLDFEDSMIVETILGALSDPSTLSDLLPPDSPEA